jgi:hypothetical protein
MSTADLFTADFPHGSPAGYDRGCTGSACPNQGDPIVYTCREAKSLKRTDYARRQHPDGEPMKRTDEPTTPVITDTEHGTPQGYRKGCRRDDCPGMARAGRTCVQAHEALQKTLDDTRSKRAAAGLAKPAPAAHALAAEEPTPASSDPVATETEIREWARANNVAVNDRGRVSTTVRDAYNAAHRDAPQRPPTPAPPTTPLTVEPISEDARAAHDTPSDELDTAHNTIANLRTALAAAKEATALATKQRDDALAAGVRLADELEERIRRHEADVADLDQVRATQLAETRRANELEEKLDAARGGRGQLERIEESYRPDVVPVVTGGDNPPTTVMTVGDVRLELPAGEVAQLKVDVGGVHVQIGR